MSTPPLEATPAKPDLQPDSLPQPWDRIFGLGTRVFVWGLLAGIVYLLRPFSLLLFLTFVFAYIQAHGVDGLAHRIPSRIARVVLVFAVFLGTLVSLGIFLVPRIQDQATTIALNYDDWLQEADTELKDFAKEQGFAKRIPESFELKGLLNSLLGFGDAEEGKEALKGYVERLRKIFTPLLGIVSAFFLSLLFSFLIVLDLPKLSRGVKGLARTKISFIYNEVADNIYNFSKVLGRAMEAQLLIALANTVLTFIGMKIIGIGGENTVFLCLLVFLCSFIPVAGVFFSTVPICIVSLQQGGVGLTLAAIVMVLIVHFIEAYFLNPQIYGAHLRMNPVLTLGILTICGKLFGFWGLILGIPIFNYIFSNAIRYQATHTDADAARAPTPA